jgi:hypothetical protein
MSILQARNSVLAAENEVTQILNNHGENSDEYKKALNNFAKSWISLRKTQDSVDSLLED